MRPYEQVDKELVKIQRNKQEYMDVYKDNLLMHFDELNTFNSTKQEQLKKRYKRYKADDALIDLYIVYLLGKTFTKEQAMRIGILIDTDTLYKSLKTDLSQASINAQKSGYDKAVEDCKGKAKKSKFKAITGAIVLTDIILALANKIFNTESTASKTGQEPAIDKPVQTASNEWLAFSGTDKDNKDNRDTNKDKQETGKPTGRAERQLEQDYNQGYEQGCEDNHVNRVLFCAVMDDRTTHMCKSLNGQIFLVNGANKFERYFASVDKVQEITCEGLVQGINLPPIDDHFHWCRSYIKALPDD